MVYIRLPNFKTGIAPSNLTRFNNGEAFTGNILTLTNYISSYPENATCKEQNLG